MGLDYLVEPLQEAFMRRALAEVIIMGAVSGVVGTFIVLRGLSFLGDALSHAIFPGVVIAFLLGESFLIGAIASGMVTSAGIAVLATNSRVKPDSVIGVLFAGTFALGVVLASTSGDVTEQLEEILFGDVLAVRTSDLWFSAIAGAGVLLLIAVLFRALVVASFDRVAAQAMGLPVFWLDLLLLVLISLTIVVSYRAVGNVLVAAMLVTPAAAARLLTDRLVVMMAISAGIGVTSGVVGLFISYHNDISAGATIVLVATAAFVGAWLFAPRHGFVTPRLRRGGLVSKRAPEAVVVFESPEIRTPGGH